MSDPDALSLDPGRVPAPRRHRPPSRLPRRPGLRRRRQPSSRHRARGAGVVVGVRSHRRRSVVKVAYVRNRRAGAWRAHGAYLARDGAQRPGQRGLGFTASRDDLDLAATLSAWQAAGDARLWKAIISPEQGAELDLRVHARALVRQMEHDLGTRLEWVAIDHHNTDNPHVHLLIRGRDDHGRPLTIDPGYIQRGIRERSEELATRVLGLRTDHEILASRARVVERAQFTELDRRLLARADAQGRVSYSRPFLADRRRLAERSQELRRLEVLVSLGLARRIGAGRWELSRELEPTLRQCQLAGDIMKSRARHQAHLSDPRLPLVVTRIEAGTRLAGRVVGAGLADELRDRRYLLLEGTDRRLHYILQTPDVERARGQAHFRVGDHITLTGHALTREGRTMVTTEIQVEPAKARPTGRQEPVPEPAALRTLAAIEREHGRPISVVAPSVEGLIYRGPLLAYAKDRDGHRYAILDTGRVLSAFRTDAPVHAPGLEIRATSAAGRDARGRQVLGWRLEVERQRQRERGRER